MVFERKIVVGLEDIASISLECNDPKCKRRITFSPDIQGQQIPRACSGCGHVWIPSEVTVPFSSTESPLGIFLQSTQKIRAITDTNPYGVRILLEYKEPSGGQREDE
jgi:hypothetical protein